MQLTVIHLVKALTLKDVNELFVRNDLKFLVVLYWSAEISSLWDSGS